MKRTLILLILLLLYGSGAFPNDPLHDYLEIRIRYWDMQDKVSGNDLDQLVALKRKADQAGLSAEERTKAYTELFHFYQKLRGLPEGRVPAQMAAAYWTEGQSPIPPPHASAKPGQLGNFIKRGSGKIPMILIPDLAADRTVFESFMERNKTRFTFYAVTLPGFGGTNPPPDADKRDYGAMKWWNNTSAAILYLMETQKINRPLILGHQAGAYLAMKIALEHPELVRGAVVLNGLLFAPLPAMPPNATIAERVRIMNGSVPAELFPHPSDSKYLSVWLQSAAWFCKSKERQEAIARMITKTDPIIWWNYFAELATTDLTGPIKGLKVPLLVLPSIYDAGSPDAPKFESVKTALAQWNSVDASNTSLPVTVVKIEDCRTYATEDQPAKLDEAIDNWTMKISRE